MNTLRNELKREYSQIPNELITDLTLSHGALRVLLYLFTKPDTWNVYNKDICKNLEISEKTLTKYWKELLSSKWLKRQKKQDKEGKLTGGYDYLIGNFTISEKSSEQEEKYEHSNNKLINKKETTMDYDAFLSTWNEYATKANKSKVAKLTDTRKKKILARSKDYKNLLDVFKYVLTKAEKSNFLLKGNFFSFDWLFTNDINMLKVYEGKYDNQEEEEVVL